MKNFKLPLLLILFALAIFNTSCKEDRSIEENESYIVDVEIVSPTNNATMAVEETFDVVVDYARQENTIHNIKVEIMDAEGNQVAKLVERHAHVANEFTFKAENVQIDHPGTYTIRAATTDLDNGDGENNDVKNLVEHTITIQ